MPRYVLAFFYFHTIIILDAKACTELKYKYNTQELFFSNLLFPDVSLGKRAMTRDQPVARDRVVRALDGPPRVELGDAFGASLPSRTLGP